ncbi:MAG: hypothetical protein KGV48_002040 [Alcaligenaceae bacterium]|nr:hypothetical protein [Alcaligenaceae bacterium]
MKKYLLLFCLLTPLCSYASCYLPSEPDIQDIEEYGECMYQEGYEAGVETGCNSYNDYYEDIDPSDYYRARGR